MREPFAGIPDVKQRLNLLKMFQLLVLVDVFRSFLDLGRPPWLPSRRALCSRGRRNNLLDGGSWN